VNIYSLFFITYHNGLWYFDWKYVKLDALINRYLQTPVYFHLFVIYLMMLLVVQPIQCQMAPWLMN